VGGMEPESKNSRTKQSTYKKLRSSLGVLYCGFGSVPAALASGHPWSISSAKLCPVGSVKQRCSGNILCFPF
jgi:hypothetical protein